jgi:hypothetical protein
VGYQRPKYKLTWEDGHELHGLEIFSKGLSIQDLKLVSSYGDLESATRTEQIEALGPLLDIFCEKLISWNYEDDDGLPVSTSREDLEKVDIRMMVPILSSWMSEVSTLSDPLPVSSRSGDTSLEELIPMDVLSENQMSLPMLS